MSAEKDYWQDCISIAAEECGLTLTDDQLSALASAAEDGHDNYGMFSYSPSSSERIGEIEREYETKMKLQREDHERDMSNAEAAVKQALRLRRDDHVAIGANGEVSLLGGRTERIQ